MHARTHARTHACTHARTHARMSLLSVYKLKEKKISPLLTKDSDHLLDCEIFSCCTWYQTRRHQHTWCLDPLWTSCSPPHSSLLSLLLHWQQLSDSSRSFAHVAKYVLDILFLKSTGHGGKLRFWSRSVKAEFGVKAAKSGFSFRAVKAGLDMMEVKAGLDMMKVKAGLDMMKVKAGFDMMEVKAGLDMI